MEKIRVLAIAPYSGLRDLINEMAKDRSELDVHTFIGDMLEGVEVVKSVQEKGYDAILSRAGTADLIKKVSDLPVIDIKLSVIDMLRAIKLAQNYVGKFVIVGFKSITDTANLICQMNEDDFQIKTLSNISEIHDCLMELKEQGVSLIVGDVVTITHAKRIGLNTILVTSGKESVSSSFDEVIKLKEMLAHTDEKNLLIKNILQHSAISVISFNSDKKVVYSNIHENLEDYQGILEDLRQSIDILLKEKEFKILKKLGNHFVNIKGYLQEIEDSFYPTYYLEKHKTAIKPFDNAISINNILESPKVNFETFFTSNDGMKNAIEDAKAYSATQAPILILGDKGTGKDTLANAIFHNSLYSKNPYIVIDTKYMSEKKWAFLYESENSLLVDRDCTIYVKNIHLMDEVSQKFFESYFLQTYVHKRNRFIFSAANSYSKLFDQSSLLHFIKNELSAFPIFLPNLNQRKDDIPSLASLFLGDLTLRYGNQVMGLEQEALKVLQDFHWTNHLSQLKRVMEELIVLTDTFYIQADTVKKVLFYESAPQLHSELHSIDLKKPLDEINKDIINLVLSEEDFNQSRAAERLGISRSTLWRKIK